MDEFKGTNPKRYKVIMALGGKCCRCGYDKCFAALDMHHVEAFTKVEDSERVYQASFDRQMEESTKCEIVCSNCHREIHAEMKIMNLYIKKNKRISHRIPYGHDLARDGIHLKVNKKEQALIKRVVKLRRELTLQKIADILNSESIPTKMGGTWYPESVRTILVRHKKMLDIFANTS